ncbi:hypothetical protein BG262_02705 [Floricoccus penangensis]|uniref:Uncharacterized protein n=1 Tax=Floricoccus penangensis TaxID=1859475 RepID=A0A9Q5JGV3_9LACT|nr:hypothetical protein [Floricoccus penangensis]OFI46726.1 hypothetical protein BG262_02705 [Floricoccus penangensis]
MKLTEEQILANYNVAYAAIEEDISTLSLNDWEDTLIVYSQLFGIDVDSIDYDNNGFYQLYKIVYKMLEDKYGDLTF